MGTLLAMTWAPGEVPCDLCGVLTLPELLERAPECCARERRCCEECVERIEAEQRDEAAASDFDARMTAIEMGLR